MSPDLRIRGVFPASGTARAAPFLLVPPIFPTRPMKRIVGLGIGVLYVVLAVIAFGKGSAGSAAGHPELGFWWGVIGVLLSIACAGAILGTLNHTRARG